MIIPHNGCSKLYFTLHDYSFGDGFYSYLRNDYILYYKMSLGIAYGIPSEATLRQRLDSIGQSMNNEIISGNISLMKACHVEPSALKNGMVPLDIDVTPMDNSKSHKEGVSRTYKNFYGYAPIMAYIGAEGYGGNEKT